MSYVYSLYYYHKPLVIYLVIVVLLVGLKEELLSITPEKWVDEKEVELVC